MAYRKTQQLACSCALSSVSFARTKVHKYRKALYFAVIIPSICRAGARDSGASNHLTIHVVPGKLMTLVKGARNDQLCGRLMNLASGKERPSTNRLSLEATLLKPSNQNLRRELSHAVSHI